MDTLVITGVLIRLTDVYKFTIHLNALILVGNFTPMVTVLQFFLGAVEQQPQLPPQRLLLRKTRGLAVFSMNALAI